jgi:hypothetical protein
MPRISIVSFTCQNVLRKLSWMGVEISAEEGPKNFEVARPKTTAGTT